MSLYLYEVICFCAYTDVQTGEVAVYMTCIRVSHTYIHRTVSGTW